MWLVPLSLTKVLFSLYIQWYVMENALASQLEGVTVWSCVLR